MSAPNPMVAAFRAQAAAARAAAAAFDAAADAMAGASAGDELVTRESWTGPGTFRVLLDAAARRELAKIRAGRTPAFRRRDVDAWLESRRGPVKARSSQDVPPANEQDDYAAAVARCRA